MVLTSLVQRFLNSGVCPREGHDGMQGGEYDPGEQVYLSNF